MKIHERVSDVTRMDGIEMTVEIDVEVISGSREEGLLVVERIESAVKDEIEEVADES